MSYATLMVYLELGQSQKGLLRITGDLAEQFDARIIGVAIHRLPYAFDMNETSSESRIHSDYSAEKQLLAAEDEFKTAMLSRSERVEWRPIETSEVPSHQLAKEARATDLLIVGINDDTANHAAPSLNTGDLVMLAGRPVLLAPQKASTLKLKNALVAWQDTRETRRAVCDALPLLRKVQHVTVVEIGPADELASARARVADVIVWLKWNGVQADALSVASTTMDMATQLYALAELRHADIIVAGAFGHARLRDWVQGGVTRDLLIYTGHCSMVSH